MLRALRIAEDKNLRQKWSRDRLLDFQRARLGELVEHASRRSAFYRRLYGGEVAAHEVELSQLPTTSKAAMMAAFDDWVTDPRLTLASVESHLSGETPGELHLGEYTLLSTSGSSGLRGVYAFSRAEWAEVMGGYFACGNLSGVRPTLPRQRVMVVAAPDAKHISFRQSVTADIGLYRVVRLAASTPIHQLAANASRFAPHGLVGYPSVLSMLAQEQLAGRVRIGPSWIITTAELRSEQMTQRIRAAWGIEPFTTFGMTEGGSVANDCAAHAGLHVLEDGIILESVDDEGRPVAAGTSGAKLLMTNLFLRSQPLIRFEVSDMVAFDERPCVCGRCSKRIVALDGRCDDVLDLPGADGEPVAVHPVRLRSTLGTLSAVAQYQVVQDGHALSIRVVPTRAEGHEGLSDAVRRTLEGVLDDVGVVGVTIDVHLVDQLERAGGGKLQLIVRRHPCFRDERAPDAR